MENAKTGCISSILILQLCVFLLHEILHGPFTALFSFIERNQNCAVKPLFSKYLIGDRFQGKTES